MKTAIRDKLFLLSCISLDPQAKDLLNRQEATEILENTLNDAADRRYIYINSAVVVDVTSNAMA